MKCRLRSSPTNGFWGLTIRFTERDNAHAEALVRALPLIGTIYGEGLCINESEDKMIYEVS